ncbi:MAG: DUF3597 domain-containing protein [Rhodospirillaceae bacterium]
MSIFGRIMDKIFRGKKAEARETPPTRTGAPQQGQFSPQAQTQQGGTAMQRPAPPQPAPMQAVDVEEVLNEMAEKNPQKLNWRTSIVDLMKLLGMESSLAERKELAQELGYKGDMNDSATMNMWLHKQVMQKLAQNGGKVPKELLD